MQPRTTTAALFRFAALLILAVSLAGWVGCKQEAAPEPEPLIREIPEATTPRDIAVIEIEGHGEIRIELLADLAPESAAHFAGLAEEGYYDGTTFHRVIEGFMIQGGCPNTRDRDPRNDGLGGNDRHVGDEISGVAHTPGIVSLANRGHLNTNGAQWFIMVGERPDLDQRYTIFGRVVEGMPIAEAISKLPTDLYGRHGPKNRPMDDVRVTRVRIERAQP